MEVFIEAHTIFPFKTAELRVRVELSLYGIVYENERSVWMEEINANLASWKLHHATTTHDTVCRTHKSTSKEEIISISINGHVVAERPEKNQQLTL